jgi:hypothetical protein
MSALRLAGAASQIQATEALPAGEIGLAFEHAPPGLLEHRLVAVRDQPAGLGGTHVVEGFVHLGDDVKAIENVDGVGAALADDPQIRLPHIRADELDADRAGPPFSALFTLWLHLPTSLRRS